MIPNNTKQVLVTGNLGQTDDFEMQVDPMAMAHIMALLTNLYSDEELACIREYSTNAIDAQFDAGVTTPIEVTTPSTLSPFLRIKDNGVGMDKATIRDIYSQYGKSTKREQVETNGSMGIGGKAALAYTSQFSVVGIKDGVKTTVSVSRREDGSGVMQVIDESATDEPNGVEIIIPTKKYNDFRHKAEKFFEFWKPGTVLLDGKEPGRSLTKMTDRIYLYDGDSDVIVMGNVAYPIDSSNRVSIGKRKVAAYVTMNGDDEVVFTPSREGLIYNGITKNAILGVKEEYDNALRNFLQECVSAAKTHFEAYVVKSSFDKEYGSNFTKGLTYKGEEVPDGQIKTKDAKGNDNFLLCTQWNVGRSRNAVETGHRTSMATLHYAKMVIVGYKGNGVSSGYKHRIKQYAIANNIQIHGYGNMVALFSDTTIPGGKWVEGVETFLWKDILAATKEQRSSGGGYSYDGKYDIYNTTGWTTEYLDEDDEVLFYSPANTSMDRELFNRIIKENPDIKIVAANANRHNKIRRLYENSRQLDKYAWFQKFGDDDFALLSDYDRECIVVKAAVSKSAYDYNLPLHMRGADLFPSAALRVVDKIADKEYADVVRKYHHSVTFGGYERYSKDYEALTKKGEKVTYKEFRDGYALMNWRSYPNETLEYMNMIYANRNKEN